MAKLSRRNQEQKIEKKEEIVSNVLTNSELLKVETSPLQIQNARLLMAVEEQALANMNLELRLLTQKIEKQKQVVADFARKYTEEKQRYDSVIAQIMKNHGLTSEKFGYNSETGEIIL